MGFGMWPPHGKRDSGFGIRENFGPGWGVGKANGIRNRGDGSSGWRIVVKKKRETNPQKPPLKDLAKAKFLKLHNSTPYQGTWITSFVMNGQRVTPQHCYINNTINLHFTFYRCCFQDSKYTAVSGFLFLRFYAPAILGPKLFGLRNNHADKNVSRTLTILAKVGII